jgi:hypothetical protein
VILYKEELRDLKQVSEIKMVTLNWISKQEKRNKNAYKALVEKTVGKRLLRKPKRRLESDVTNISAWNVGQAHDPRG